MLAEQSSFYRFHWTWCNKYVSRYQAACFLMSLMHSSNYFVLGHACWTQHQRKNWRFCIPNEKWTNLAMQRSIIVVCDVLLMGRGDRVECHIFNIQSHMNWANSATEQSCGKRPLFRGRKIAYTECGFFSYTSVWKPGISKLRWLKSHILWPFNPRHSLACRMSGHVTVNCRI